MIIKPWEEMARPVRTWQSLDVIKISRFQLNPWAQAVPGARYDKIKASIEKDGMVNPIVVCWMTAARYQYALNDLILKERAKLLFGETPDLVIPVVTVGNNRLQVAIDLGWETVECACTYSEPRAFELEPVSQKGFKWLYEES